MDLILELIGSLKNAILSFLLLPMEIFVGRIHYLVLLGSIPLNERSYKPQHVATKRQHLNTHWGVTCPLVPSSYKFRSECIFPNVRHGLDELLKSERFVGCGCPMLFQFFSRSLRTCNELLKSACSALDTTSYSNLPNFLDDIKKRTYGLLLPYAL